MARVVIKDAKGPYILQEGNKKKSACADYPTTSRSATAIMRKQRMKRKNTLNCKRLT
ncbi:hypothetical protein GCM10007416_33770 [Kroppenstedtia guangzhouensis]|uniref:Uncharacterized protein n=1 Tax=Kroppenstedtia guangzhouensis TaxID=1274356 RepID=A0ABQ1H3T7_9BACL|nr:hypothetical protein GCM10007416_33770 [Kroppenstedtia guangzhouensis]